MMNLVTFYLHCPLVYTEWLMKPEWIPGLRMCASWIKWQQFIFQKKLDCIISCIRGGVRIHQTKSNTKGSPSKSKYLCGRGGPPSCFGAIVPCEGMKANLQARKQKSPLFTDDGFLYRVGLRFVIWGRVFPNENKRKGPFRRSPPVIIVWNMIYADDACFTGYFIRNNDNKPIYRCGERPPGDTSFGALWNKEARSKFQFKKKLFAVDAAGVHPFINDKNQWWLRNTMAYARAEEVLTIPRRSYTW